MIVASEKLLTDQAIADIVNSDCEDIFSLLGLHRFDAEKFIVRVFLPGAQGVDVIDKHTQKALAHLNCLHSDGLYAGLIEVSKPFEYQLQVQYELATVLLEDPYRFPSILSDDDLYLLGEGNHDRLYDFMGAHCKTINNVAGVVFTVWAPNARRVSVIGDFNHWDGRRHMMRKHIPSGIWEIFIPELQPGVLYKFELRSLDGNLLPHKTDPFAFACQHPPETASIVVAEDHYSWDDENWLQQRNHWTERSRPIAIYEVHLGSWAKISEDGNRYLSYGELADQLIPYVLDMGFTHIQLMPITEYPFDGSWGYQPIGLFAPTSRFGTPDEFKNFVDSCHQVGLAVLIDWVPGHFPMDEHGLGRFDGTPLYEHADHRQGFHPDWNTFIYNYGRCEVANYLYSNALFWFDRFHIDGLRVDAVASMLYLDYSRDEGQWLPNAYGGRENLEAIDLIKKVNEKVYSYFPNAMMVAEESTAWPGVSQPTYLGGLGFGYKWNMGWMNDTLRYIARDPVHRQYHHHDMTFSLLYAFSENFILPLSHDEVVHEKGSILARMPGDCWQQFANMRAYLAYMWTHPGKKLLFMGSEFAQGQEWNHDQSLDWHLLDIDEHRGMQHLVRDLNRLYRKTPTLYTYDSDAHGFEWIEADDRHQSVFAFIRKGEAADPFIVVVINMTPVLRHNFRIGLPCEGYYVERLNTDSEQYGGSNQGNQGGKSAEAVTWQGRDWSMEITLPALAAVIFELT